jgi:hypothetical protein
MRAQALWLTFLVGCELFGSGEKGSGTPKTETRDVGAFTKVQLEGSLHADITAGGAQHVEISGDDNLVPLVTTEVKDQHLRVYTTKQIRPKLDLVARISAPAVTAVSASGSSVIQVHGVQGEAFALDTSGSARITAAGTAQKLTIDVTGSASIDAKELKAQNVTIEVSGSGDLDVYATDVLDVSISGSGKVRYYGHPRDVKKSISGSGTLEPH